MSLDGSARIPPETSSSVAKNRVRLGYHASERSSDRHFALVNKSDQPGSPIDYCFGFIGVFFVAEIPSLKAFLTLNMLETV